ncbi:MAG TPA: SDR family NAD(P)-dependent oxidoreductase [Chloroflexota bacterium]|jgi:3-oxoacyl-[acyl-carrier protein] reductase|nr:SDR family NAD(P)-dependent oxidoreductase [Chloroflexota bacterium]
MSDRLSGRVAIVTGGGRGIGAAIAQALAIEGAAVALAARSRDQLEAVAATIRGEGGRALAVVADVAQRADAERIVAETTPQLGPVDVLVNCAGVYGPIGPSHEVDPVAWARAIEVNLLGTFYCCQAVLPGMIERRRGKIVNMSGGGATAPLARFSAYAASKAAVVRLTETLAEEVAPFGVRVNAIAPGAIDTGLQDEVLAAGERAGPLYDRIKALRETGAGGTSIDLPARLAAFLASDDSAGLTGRLIAAPYDGWERWDEARIGALEGTPWFTLRRIDPHTIRPLEGKIP